MVSTFWDCCRSAYSSMTPAATSTTVIRSSQRLPPRAMAGSFLPRGRPAHAPRRRLRLAVQFCLRVHADPGGDRDLEQVDAAAEHDEPDHGPAARLEIARPVDIRVEHL